MYNIISIFRHDMDLTISKFWEALTDPFTAVGVLGTTAQAVVVGSTDVNVLKEVGSFAPNVWSVFLPAIATAILVSARAFVLVRSHIIEQKRANELHELEIKQRHGEINS